MFLYFLLGNLGLGRGISHKAKRTLMSLSDNEIKPIDKLLTKKLMGSYTGDWNEKIDGFTKHDLAVIKVFVQAMPVVFECDYEDRVMVDFIQHSPMKPFQISRKALFRLMPIWRRYTQMFELYNDYCSDLKEVIPEDAKAWKLINEQKAEITLDDEMFHQALRTKSAAYGRRVNKGQRLIKRLGYKPMKFIEGKDQGVWRSIVSIAV